MKSIPVAVTAVTFMTFIIIVFLFPSSPNPNSATMNYTVVVLGKLFFLKKRDFLQLFFIIYIFTSLQVERLLLQFFIFIFRDTVELCGLKDL